MLNGCPCGDLTDPRGRCRCPSTKVAAYLAKLSGPLLDRIDLHVEIPAVPYALLAQAAGSEPSSAIRTRILQARTRQRERWRRLRVTCNAQLRHRMLREACPLTDHAAGLLKSAMQEFHFSARAYEKILKLARTIADLAGGGTLQPEHLAEAIQYRSLDRQLWL